MKLKLCIFCGQKFKGRGKAFCSVSCVQKMNQYKKETRKFVKKVFPTVFSK